MGLFLALLILLVPGTVFAQESDVTCAVYFTGVGCSHCAKTDPFLLVDLLQEHPDLIVIEYEIYQTQGNVDLLLEYDDTYGSGFGIPLLIFSKDAHIDGDRLILRGAEALVGERRGNPCPLPDGTSVGFAVLDPASLPKRPKIWAKERVLIYSTAKVDGALLRKLLTAEDIPQALEGVEYEVVDPQSVPLSGRNVEFVNAVKILPEGADPEEEDSEGWLLEWEFPAESGDSSGSGIPWNIVGAILVIAGSGAGILHILLRRRI